MILSIQRFPVAAFLALTFALALIPWLFCALAKIDPFSNIRWMPLVLAMVWTPAVSAVLVTAATGGARPLLASLLVLPRNPTVWLFALTPLLIALLVWKGRLELAGGPLLAFLAFHLVLGPLGEEIGWRGFLLPRLEHFGTLGAPVAVGFIWGIWHAPLWWLNSPHAHIPFGVFLAMCVCFSVIMSAAQWLAPSSVLPAVLFHWLVNVTVGLLEMNEVFTLRNAYARLLPYYFVAAIVAAYVNWQREASICGAELG